MRRVQSKKHKIGTYEVIKISYFDDKRFVLDDGIDALSSYFHKDCSKRFSQMIINKRRFSRVILRKRDCQK